MKKKTYILDTNVLLTDPDSLFSFKDNEIILPFTIIEELDKIKGRPNEVGANAREIARKLSELISSTELGSLKKGIRINNNGLLRVVAVSDFSHERLQNEWDPTNKDNHILEVCRGLYQEALVEKKEPPVLVTRDIVLRVKCDFLGIPCEDYKKSSVAENPDRLYVGHETIEVPDEVIQDFWETTDGENDFNCVIDDYCKKSPSPNQFITLQSSFGEQKDFQVVRYLDKGEPLKIIREIKKPIFNVTPRNKEQNLALDLLLDPAIKMITLIGRAGSGKTLISIAAGLNQVLEKKKYKSLVVCRPIVPVGNDIGYLPGPVPLYSKVLTPKGFVEMGSLKIGDMVVAKDGQPTIVEKVLPQGKKEILEITFQDGAKIECCEDHYWAVYQTNNKVRKVLSTKQLETIQNELGWDKKWWNRHFIDLVGPVEYEKQDKELIIHPYVLGCVLGDGCITAKYSNEFSSNDLEIVSHINKFISEQPYTLRHKSGQSYHFTMVANIGRNKRKVNTFTTAINNLGLRGTNSKTKFIPNEYLMSSIENRRLILQGLMDTDGYVSADGSDVSYTTTSATLAENVKTIVLSLGGMANIKYNQNKFNSYTVSISFGKKEECPFLLKRKALRWKPRTKRILRRIDSVIRTGRFAEMQCITISNPEHLYVMDNFVVTHNSKEEKLEPWIAPIKDNLRFLLFSGRKSKNAEQTLQGYFDDGVIEVEAITYLRGRSIADAFIIIDEAQNLTAHELKTIITRVGENTKIVLTGDIEQIDNIYIDSVSNGLTVAVEKFKEYPIAGHVTLVKGERSELASLASRIL